MERKRIDQVRSGSLAGGVPYLAMSRPGSGVVSLQIWVCAGSRMEAQFPGSGVAHFLEHMVFKGTENRTALEINRQAERLGGFLNAYTSYDRTVYHIDLPADQAEKGLELLADFVWSPSLAEEGFASERDVILREIAMYRDDPDSFLFDALMEAGLTSDLLRFPFIGLEERFRALTIEDLRSFHREYYRSCDSFLLMAGDLSPGLHRTADAVAPALREGRLNSSAGFLDPELADKPVPVRLRLRGDWEGGRGTVLFVVPTRSLEEVLMAEWVVEVLSGGESSSLSRVIRRERELVHFFDGYVYSLGNSSLLGFSWLAEGSDLAETEDLLFDELTKIAAVGLSPEDFQRGRDRLRFDRLRQDETIEGWASRGGESFRNLLSVSTWEMEAAILGAFENQDFCQYLNQYLSPDRAIAGQLHPGGAA